MTYTVLNGTLNTAQLIPKFEQWLSPRYFGGPGRATEWVCVSCVFGQ